MSVLNLIGGSYSEYLELDLLKYTEIDLPMDLKTMLSDFFFSSLDQMDKYYSDRTNVYEDSMTKQEEESFHRFLVIMRSKLPPEEIESMVKGLGQMKTRVKKHLAENLKIQFNTIKNLEERMSEIEELVKVEN